MTKSPILKLLTGIFCAAAIFASPASLHGAADAKTQKSPATTTASDQPGAARFYGTISAVDATAMTFTIDNQTYAIVSESQLVKAADDKPATIADAVVGETARGSYTKTDDGKLKVTKVRFGKKAGGGGKAAGKKGKEAATQPAEKKPAAAE